MKNRFNLNEALLEDIQPYLGCTDVCIAGLGAALAASAAQGTVPGWLIPGNPTPAPQDLDPGQVISLHLKMNEGLFKNSHGGAVPNSGGRKGIVHSAALGLFCNPGKKLNLFEDAGPEHIDNMEQLAAARAVSVEVLRMPECNLYLHCKLILKNPQGGVTTAVACLQNHYTRVMVLTRNERILYQIPVIAKRKNVQEADFNIPRLLRELEHLSPEVLQKLDETIAMNRGAYEYGLSTAPGLGIGRALARLIEAQLIGDDAANFAASTTAAAEDVRMAGENIAVMGITGSGSHGIAASIPVIATAQKIKKDRRRLLESIALSFRLTQQVDALNGHLTAPCGCVIKAGIGAAAGVAYYLGANAHQVEQAINHFIVSTAGIFCDGAKATCAIKLAHSASSACHSALLAIQGIALDRQTGGVVRQDLDQNIRSMVRISKRMQPVDTEITSILKEYDALYFSSRLTNRKK
jgi:L-cysteine desulfidase